MGPVGSSSSGFKDPLCLACMFTNLKKRGEGREEFLVDFEQISDFLTGIVWYPRPIK